MQVTGRITAATIDIKTNNPMLVLAVNERRDFGLLVDDLKNVEKLSIEIKPYRKKRSLDANAYCWVLLDKLSEAFQISKIEIYRSLIRDIGGNSEVVCVTKVAVDRLCSGWERNGIGWQTERFPSKIPGCVNVILYYGSSTYDAAQMSSLIDRIVEECKMQNIQTATPEEIENMKSLWAGARR